MDQDAGDTGQLPGLPQQHALVQKSAIAEVVRADADEGQAGVIDPGAIGAGRAVGLVGDDGVLPRTPVGRGLGPYRRIGILHEPVDVSKGQTHHPERTVVSAFTVLPCSCQRETHSHACRLCLPSEWKGPRRKGPRRLQPGARDRRGASGRGRVVSGWGYAWGMVGGGWLWRTWPWGPVARADPSGRSRLVRNALNARLGDRADGGRLLSGVKFTGK